MLVPNNMATKSETHIKELMKRKPPLVVVNAVIQDGENVLLIKRGKEPYKGGWVVPGGHVGVKEDLEEAIVREVKEETGLKVKVIGIIHTEADKAGLDPRGYHLAITFLVYPIGGKLVKTDEAQEVRWFKLGDLPDSLVLGSEKYFQETITKEQQIAELVKFMPSMPMVNQIIYRNNFEILLGKRNKPPYWSEWALPGGHFSYKETIEEASTRKAKEETGLVVEVEDIIDVYSDFGVDPRSRNLVITHLCKVTGGDLKVGNDFSEFYWYDLRKELTNDIKVINKGFLRAIEKAKMRLVGKQNGD